MFLGFKESNKSNAWQLLDRNLRHFEFNSNSSPHISYWNTYFDFLTPSYLNTINQTPSFNDSWHYYVHSNSKRIQMENLWLEDRVAMANGIENRVPFLDHRIIEYLARVPKKLYKRLLWDKNILRNGMSRLLPNKITGKEKTPFFHGRGVGFSNRSAYNILRSNDDYLIKEAFDKNQPACEVIKREVVLEWIKRIPADPDYAGVQRLMPLINMALLEKMAHEEFSAFPKPRPNLTSAIKTNSNWDKIEQLLISNLEFDGINFNKNSKLKLSHSCLLLFDPKQKCWYISKNNQLVYKFSNENDEKDLLEIIKHLDGMKTLKELSEFQPVSISNVSEKLLNLLVNELLMVCS